MQHPHANIHATTSHTTTVSAEPFTVFASLQQGDHGPGWLQREITQAWALDPVNTQLWLIAVSENATFRVDIFGEPYAVLRVHRPGYVDPVQIRSELQWLQSLADMPEINVPQVLPLASGELVHSFHRSAADGAGADEAPWHVVAFAFLPGTVLEDVIDELPDPASYYQRIGAATAALHEQQRRWVPPGGFDRFQWRFSDMLGPSSRWGDWRGAALSPAQHHLLETAEKQALSDCAQLRTGDTGWGLIHADLRPSNIMFNQDELTIIDFDDCGWGWLVYDFASAFSFIEHEPYVPSLAAQWVRGYQSVRPLSDQDLRHGCALSMIRRLTMLGWTTTHRQDALPASVWDAQIPGTVEVADRYLRSPTWLLE